MDYNTEIGLAALAVCGVIVGKIVERDQAKRQREKEKEAGSQQLATSRAECNAFLKKHQLPLISSSKLGS
ncbi:MAG: hypothetical protein FWF24_05640 [Alphaproteobacteria bacterium]|nr:hypothetical protein [Alphaproteobacteria bacterium]